MANVIEAKATDEVILDAADRLLARYGLRKMTMYDVALEAGVSRRTVYGYFGSKTDLALASIDRVVRLARERMTAESNGPGTASDRLERMLVGRIAVRLQQVQPFSQNLDAMFDTIRPAYMERRQRWIADESAQLAEVIREGQRAGVFGADDDADESAAILVRATNAYLPFSLRLEELGDLPVVLARLERMSQILVAGLAAA